jgi:predicted nucleotidyltransferase
VQVIFREILLQKELDRMVKILKQKYCPQKIILFGSLANGKLKDWSDLDLLIIKGTHRRLIDRIEEVIRMCRPKVATDFIIYTREEFEELSRNESFVRKEIIEKGRILYKRK